jgi:hypothetical protein
LCDSCGLLELVFFLSFPLSVFSLSTELYLLFVREVLLADYGWLGWAYVGNAGLDCTSAREATRDDF